jgi:hypothetical protein
MDEPPSTKDDAQERADQIAAFKAEIALLQREGIEPFTPAEAERIARHHEAVVQRLAAEFDIDQSVAERRMSVGMRVASAFGAATLTAAVVSFVYQFWGNLSTTAQVVLLTAGPIVGVMAAIVAGRIERTRYVAAVMAVVACGAFVVQTVLLGQIFNLRSSPHPLLLWGIFAMAVAVPWRFTLPFGLGVMAVDCYAAAIMFWLAGVDWSEFTRRPEPLMLSSLVLLPLTARVPRELLVPGRAVLLVLTLGPLLLLSESAGFSLLALNPSTAKVLYEAITTLAVIGVVAVGVQRSQDEVILIGALFGGLFLLTRFVDWWWDWMPRYLFFLVLAGVAFAWIWVLRVLRRHAAARLQ